jgi:FkbM family methyltransferase
MAGVAEFAYTTLLRPALLRRVANALILSALPETVRVGPATIHLNSADPVVSGALVLRVFERRELAFFSQICRPGMTVIDIGANVGVYTALAMHAVGPAGAIVSIEPHDESRRFLARTIAANANANIRPHVFDCAASDHEGTGKLFLNPENKADNRLYLSDQTPNMQSAPVRLRTIDAVLDEVGITSVDILKIDVQGSELAAITGAAKTIRNSPEMTLLTEFWPDGIHRASGHDGQRYIDLLCDLGFELFELRRGQLVPLSVDWPQRLTGRRYTNLVGIKARRPSN